ncbi:acetyl-CoA C-acetyltransferase [Rhodopirellula maiorica SM1]|uniref:Acetyl-CoA C-acetyltransferase n=1 Tax=Rhodopirellula maiorica SM1 TaxID=1265738 RepID=M5RPK1_9BACT|nr:acetyl-CoA C-acyltransferase [Rhodopirellula maiorica]EMI21225.1 acetyl-CoA C-acetyltransferase [Rhodopirellula maiorica SM1]
MTDAYILSACRTPMGRFQGELAPLAATSLGAIVVREAVVRSRLSVAAVNEVILGQVLTAGVGQAPSRQAAIHAGLLPSVAALTINKVCGSGLKAISLAAQAVQCGDADVVVAGGMESMSQAGWVLPRDAAKVGDRRLLDSLTHDGLTCSFSRSAMGEIADQLAETAKISRSEQDLYALQSHQRATQAIDSGGFDTEIVPVVVARPSGESTVRRDSGPRSDTTLESLSALKPAFHPQGTVTAGNASMISDGAAAVVVGNQSASERSGQRPLCRIVASATSGSDPAQLFVTPVEAVLNVVRKSGYSLSEIDLFEINEAFAVQMLACLEQLAIPADRVNVNGGAIALGHPIGASGARVLVTLLHALRARGGRLGVAALCLGGGNAVAMLVDTEVGS